MLFESQRAHSEVGKHEFTGLVHDCRRLILPFTKALGWGVLKSRIFSEPGRVLDHTRNFASLPLRQRQPGP